MKQTLTSKQMINIELAARAANKKITKLLKHHVPLEVQDNLILAFSCECSNPDCQDRILLSLEAYEKIHKNFARFVVLKGHDEPAVEKVEKTGVRASIVKKYALS